MNNKKINGDIGKDILLNEISLYFKEGVTANELDHALNILSNRVIDEESNNNDKSRISKLLLLRIFCFMYSTDSGLRQRTYKEVLDVYSVTDSIIEKSREVIFNSLVNIIQENKINNTVRVGNVNALVR